MTQKNTTVPGACRTRQTSQQSIGHAAGINRPAIMLGLGDGIITTVNPGDGI